jgi:hypothetical protein
MQAGRSEGRERAWERRGAAAGSPVAGIWHRRGGGLSSRRWPMIVIGGHIGTLSGPEALSRCLRHVAAKGRIGGPVPGLKRLQSGEDWRSRKHGACLGPSSSGPDLEFARGKNALACQHRYLSRSVRRICIDQGRPHSAAAFKITSSALRAVAVRSANVTVRGLLCVHDARTDAHDTHRR